MSFDTEKEEKRIFERVEWCFGLFNKWLGKEMTILIGKEPVHLTVINKYAVLDWHFNWKFTNNLFKILLGDVRYTTEETFDKKEGYISEYKKLNGVDKIPLDCDGCILIEEHPSSIDIFNLLKADWSEIKPSKLSKRAYYFNKQNTPYVSIPICRNETLSKNTEYALYQRVTEEYNNIKNLVGELIHMTNKT